LHIYAAFQGHDLCGCTPSAGKGATCVVLHDLRGASK